MSTPKAKSPVVHSIFVQNDEEDEEFIKESPTKTSFSFLRPQGIATTPNTQSSIISPSSVYTSNSFSSTIDSLIKIHNDELNGLFL